MDRHNATMLLPRGSYPLEVKESGKEGIRQKTNQELYNTDQIHAIADYNATICIKAEGWQTLLQCTINSAT